MRKELLTEAKRRTAKLPKTALASKIRIKGKKKAEGKTGIQTGTKTILSKSRKRKRKLKGKKMRLRLRPVGRVVAAKRRRKRAVQPVTPPHDVSFTSPAEPAVERGVQLIGFSRRETGIGESCRLAAEAMETAGTPFGIIHYTDQHVDRETDLTWVHKELESPRYKVNIFHMNADTLQVAAEHYGEDLFRNRYNIGYWHWELPDFPEEWCPSFNLVQEVWVPSLFVLDSVSRKSTVPVLRIPHGISVKVPDGFTRASFGLPESQFLFLAMFDARSVMDRKNPMASIEAFKQAFAPDDPAAGLIVKMNNPYPAAVEQVKQLVEGYRNIHVLNGVLERGPANALLSLSDSVVSLHRAEGYGLTLAEGMYLGKPAIGTNWSGNTDFMTNMNSCPVNYRFTSVGTDFGPYRAYQTWAEPDIEHAAYYMRRLVQEPSYREWIGAQGQTTIRTHFSPTAVGGWIHQRLSRLGLL